MSVWVCAVMGHRWNSFSRDVIQSISSKVTSGAKDPKWLQYPTDKSPEEQFVNDGAVTFFLPDDFTIKFSRQLLNFGKALRWSTFLVDEKERQRFMDAVNKVAELAQADEILYLPENTILEDMLYDDIGFDGFKTAAKEKWGEPDLDLKRMSSLEEVYGFSGERVHYGLVGRL